MDCWEIKNVCIESRIGIHIYVVEEFDYLKSVSKDVLRITVSLTKNVYCTTMFIQSLS